MSTDTPLISPPEQTAPNWVLRVPPPIWALIFLGAAIALHLLFHWTKLGDLYALPIIVLLIGGGLALGVWAIRIFMMERTQLKPTSPANAKLIARGPFLHTRNPMYLGVVMITLGIAFAVGTFPFFLVPVAMFLLINGAFIPYEEAKMERQFGDAYRIYKKRVRRWL
jgi:protein-S-isoprenylcysteine O-methyltransferase Ste14